MKRATKVSLSTVSLAVSASPATARAAFAQPWLGYSSTLSLGPKASPVSRFTRSGWP